MPVPRLVEPASIDDLLLYRIGHLLASAGSMVIRLCEGRFGITRREWRILALLAREEGLGSSQLAGGDAGALDRHLDALQAQADRMVLQAQLPKADRRCGGRTRRALG